MPKRLKNQRRPRTDSPLARLYRSLGLNLDEAAVRGGVSRGHLLNLQAGRHNVTAQTVEKLATGWGISSGRVYSTILRCRERFQAA